MRNYSILFAAALILSGCCNTAKISGTIKDAAEGSRIVVGTDTLSLAPDGSFRTTVEVEKDQPQFLYATMGGRRIASLVLSAGDRVRIESDTLASLTLVEGSPESSLLMQADAESDRFLADFQTSESLKDASLKYVAYYRSRIRFVLENKGSLAVIPVLTQKINEDLPVFNQLTDAILFRQCLDTLKTLYPKSRYVKALESETLRRENMLRMDQALSQASVLGFPNLILPGLDGQNVSLAGVEAKNVLLHFWDPSQAEQKMLNIDALLPLYEKYHDSGFEIYSVCISADKPLWASVVKGQKLPWINVCDGLGFASRALSSYNVRTLPMSVLISGGEILSATHTSDAAELRKEIQKKL